MNHLRRITLAMLMYERDHGTLPPAFHRRQRPASSQLRVSLLPYLGQSELYGKIRLDEPWNSQHNRQFHADAPAIYRCPSAKLAAGLTTYSVVVGKKSAFEAGQGKSLDKFGVRLVLVVERKQPVFWMDPTSELSTPLPARESGNRKAARAMLGVPTASLMSASQRQCSTVVAEHGSHVAGLLDGTLDHDSY